MFNLFIDICLIFISGIISIRLIGRYYLGAY